MGVFVIFGGPTAIALLIMAAILTRETWVGGRVWK